MNLKSIIASLGMGLALTANGAELSPFDWTDVCEEVTSSILSSEELAAIIDNNEKTEVVKTFDKDETITFKLREDFKLFSYLIDGPQDKTYGPTAWTVECSKDGNEWTSFDSRTGQSYNEPYWKLEFKKDPGNADGRDNIAAYRYVRFTFPAGNFGVSEIQLYGFFGNLIQGITANGGVLRAEHQGNTGWGELYTNLTNDKISKKYGVNGTKNLWVEYVSPKMVRPESYAITSCVADNGRDPKSWRFEGFNEKTFSWETIDEQSNFKFTQRFSTIIFPVNTDKQYCRFRLSITNNNGDNYTQFCKWHIFGTETSEARTRVACVGNSITENTALGEADKYPSQLGAILGSDYQVLNYGISERTLLKNGNKPYVNEWKYNEVLGWKPDVVVIKLGTNDSKESNWTHKGEFVSDYKELIESFQNLESHPTVFICKPLPAYSNNMNIRGEIIRDEICPKIDEVAAQTGAKVIDLFGALSGNESLFLDGVHPNASGASIMAKVVANAINPAIEVPSDMYLTLAVSDWTDRGTMSGDAEALVDNNAETDCNITSANGTAKAVITLEEGVKLTGYSVTSGATPSAAPTAWTLQGSNDGTEWTDIDTRTGEKFYHKAETHLYTISLPEDRNTLPSYTWYRLVMTPADGQQAVNLSEWQLLGFAENLVTNITSNGGVITGEHPGYNQGGYVEIVENLINDNINTKYCATGYYTGWVEYNAMQKVKLSGYSIVAAKDLPNRNPKSWKLEGYNADNDTWETLDERTDCEFLVNHHTLRFDINPDKAYERIRLNITANKGEVHMQFGKWQLFGDFEGQRKIRVACTGNSITANARLEVADRYVSKLQNYLGDEYAVENFGVGGATIIKGSSYPYWDREAYKTALAFKPDVLIAKFGTNDSNPSNWAKKDQFVSDYVEYINSFKAVNPEVKVVLCYPLTSWNSTMPIVDKTVKEEIIPMIDEIASLTGATVVDLHTPTEGKVYLTYDYVHPGAAGTTLMARLIAPAVKPDVVLPDVLPGFWQRVEDFDRTCYAITKSDEHKALFDNNVDTEVNLGTMTDGGIEIEFELPENFRTTGYAITWGDADPANAPTSWTLQVSADGSEWKDIDSRSNQVFLSRLETNMYQISIADNKSKNAVLIPTGKYFRLTLKGNTGNTGNVTLAELQLFGANEKLATEVTGNGGKITNQYDGFNSNGYVETVDKLINDDITSKYCVTGHKSFWVQYESPRPVVIDRYSITNAFDDITRNPKSWDLQGSNDGVNWETLDSRDDQSFMVRLNTVEYPVTTDKSYTHYRLNVRDNNGSNETQLAKWQLFEKKTPTGVEQIETEDKQVESLYNLSGLPVDRTYKGIVISKGQKRMAK